MSEPIISHDGNVPLTFFASIDSKPEFLSSIPSLTYDHLYSCMSNSSKRVKQYASLRNKLLFISRKIMSVRIIETICPLLKTQRKIRRRNKLKLRRLRLIHRKHLARHNSLFKPLSQPRLNKASQGRRQSRLALTYAKHYNNPQNRPTLLLTQSSPIQLSARINDRKIHTSLSTSSLALKTTLTHKKLPYEAASYTNMYPDSGALRTKLRNFSPQLTRQLNFYPDITP